MSYYSQWVTRSEDKSDPKANEAYLKQYYDLETAFYDQLLGQGRSAIRGRAADLAAEFGLAGQMDLFLAILDGLTPGLESPETFRESIDQIDDDTQLDLAIDFEKLYWRMHEVGADWLYNLASWDRCLSQVRRDGLAKSYRQSRTVRREKVGRNDPCPCGSGKKYKACCGKNQGGLT